MPDPLVPRYGLRAGGQTDWLESKKNTVSRACLKSRREKLLDDTQALLYFDPEFDRQFDISL